LAQVGSIEELAGAWLVSADRVTSLEDRLTGLQSTAPDESRGAQARDLRDAVRVARLGVQNQVATGDPTSVAPELGSMAAQLESALDSVTPEA
jgi:hypothetical protein